MTNQSSNVQQAIEHAIARLVMLRLHPIARAGLGETCADDALAAIELAREFASIGDEFIASLGFVIGIDTRAEFATALEDFEGEANKRADALERDSWIDDLETERMGAREFGI